MNSGYFSVTPLANMRVGRHDRDCYTTPRCPQSQGPRLENKLARFSTTITLSAIFAMNSKVSAQVDDN